MSIPQNDSHIKQIKQEVSTNFKKESINIEHECENEAIPWPNQIAHSALFGLSGEIINTIDPYTEADKVAVLGSLFTAFGCCVGRSPYFDVSGTRHGMNLFTALVGGTAKGRKGTSWGYIGQLFKVIDQSWSEQCINSGLSSGEGIIWAVRDDVNGNGIAEKRLFIKESELGQAFQVLRREGNTLSGVLRQAWDGATPLQALTKTSKAKATDAHIAILGHITKDELLRSLAEVELLNGLGNRIIWLCVRRSKLLPTPKQISTDILTMLSKKLSVVLNFARSADLISRNDAAEELWRTIYPNLSSERPGLAGIATARAEAQVMRLACIYALFDKSNNVTFEHLEAALAFWKYAEQSAYFIFGGSPENKMQEAILNFLKEKPRTQTEINIDCFKKNKSSVQIKNALEGLSAAGKIMCYEIKANGLGKRNTTVWSLATDLTK